MNGLKVPYYKLIKVLLLLAGLWPYTNTWIKYVYVSFVYFILAIDIVLQIWRLPSVIHTLDSFSMTVLQILMCFLSIARHLHFFVHNKEVKIFLKEIEQHWNVSVVKEELQIIQKFSTQGELITIASAVSSCIIVTLNAGVIYLPKFMDTVAPLNGSEKRKVSDTLMSSGLTEVIDPTEHFYIIFLYDTLQTFLGFTVLVATETIYLMFMHHICALYKITSYRITRAIGISNEEINDSEKTCKSDIAMIFEAIKGHQRAIRFYESILSFCSLSYLIVHAIVAIIMSFSMFQAFQHMIKNDWDNVMMYAILVIIGTIYLYCINFGLQAVTNFQHNVSRTIYSACWYVTPTRTQKLLLFMMKRSMCERSAVFGGIFTASLEGFATILKMSVSYFMLMYSFQ